MVDIRLMIDKSIYSKEYNEDKVNKRVNDLRHYHNTTKVTNVGGSGLIKKG